MKVDLCLIDCSSIQKYVFGSNKLKSIIGASYNVAQIFDKWIGDTLIKDFKLKVKEQFNLDAWEKEPDKLLLCTDKNILVEAGYIGGGNALLIFRKENNDTIKANDFLKKWSRSILFNYPGIVPAATILEAETSNDNIPKETIDKIFAQLAKSKTAAVPNTIIARHGITGECPYTGLSMENKFQEPDKVTYISSSLKSKIENVDKANKQLESLLNDLQKTQDYQFPEELDDLGQSPSENHIAIVHIDGNSMGEAFQNCDTLAKRRALSKKVNDATNEAFNDTLHCLINKMNDLEKNKIIYNSPGKKIKNLPIRPIILNGDDVTFICNARISFWLAETFIKAFEKQSVEKPKLSACAGIAITKTKYPFYRGYELAEELCAEAKKIGRENSESWLDFHIAFSGLSGDLEVIRKKQYQAGSNNLLWRPWKIGKDGDHSIEKLKAAIDLFINGEKEGDKDNSKQKPWPRSKIKKLAQILVEGETATREFLRIEESKSVRLPHFINNDEKQYGWYKSNSHSGTPFLDIIEVMDFYPECLLKPLEEGK